MWVSAFHRLQAGGKQHFGSDRVCHSVGVELMAEVKKGPDVVLAWGFESKGEAKHCKCPTDTGANKRLLVPAGDLPGPLGMSRIKRSAQRSRRRVGSAEHLQSHTLRHPVSADCGIFDYPAVRDTENFADLCLYNKPRGFLFKCNRLCPFNREEMIIEACWTEFAAIGLDLSPNLVIDLVTTSNIIEGERWVCQSFA